MHNTRIWCLCMYSNEFFLDLTERFRSSPSLLWTRLWEAKQQQKLLLSCTVQCRAVRFCPCNPTLNPWAMTVCGSCGLNTDTIPLQQVSARSVTNTKCHWADSPPTPPWVRFDVFKYLPGPKKCHLCLSRRQIKYIKKTSRTSLYTIISNSCLLMFLS